MIDACELKVGEKLVSDSGETLEVVSVETWAESAPVYNFEVEDWHTYFVAECEGSEAVWVHNEDCNPWNTFLSANRGRYSGKNWLQQARLDYLSQSGRLSELSLVLFDSNSIFNIRKAKQLVRAGETPVITETIKREVIRVARRDGINIGSRLDDFLIVPEKGTWKHMSWFKQIQEVLDGVNKRGADRDILIGLTGGLSNIPVISEDVGFIETMSHAFGEQSVRRLRAQQKCT